MKQLKWRIAALCTAVALLLSGCGSFMEQLESQWRNSYIIAYEDMEYSRPDMQQIEQTITDCCETAAEEKDLEKVVEAIETYYIAYDQFYTNYTLAQIKYSGDLTDIYWEDEYNFCAENAATVDAGLEELYYALADSPCREELESDEYFGADFFDAYEGESIWDDTFVALMEEEARLQNRYYELSSQAMEEEYYSEAYFSKYAPQLTELLVELIALRQQIAAAAGYDSYPEYAFDMYHYRDYTPVQAEAYLQEVGEKMYSMYWQINQSDIWWNAYDYCSEDSMYEYVKTAAENMGGSVQDAFALLENGGLYDISYGENKAATSFETFLWSYYEPFVFVSPGKSQDDKLTFAHEFGHFANDYVCSGSAAGTDVAEVHSQAMEYLSLLYNEDTEDLEAYKLATSLCTYMEQAAYALFEQQMYALEGEDLTAENVQALYQKIGQDFGLDSWGWDSRDFIAIEHFYTMPMYVVSYVVSNDVAFQIYQMEKEEAGAGLAVYESCLESMDTYLLAFTETYGLESPFAPGRLDKVCATLESGLADYLT